MSYASMEFISLWSDIEKLEIRLYNANSNHFYALSILFLLPIFFIIVLYPSFHLEIFHPDYKFTSFTQFLSNLSLSSFEIIALIMCTMFVVLLFLCAVATITYSAVQASYGRPINLVLSIKSIRNSFFPVLSTFIVSHSIFISITLVFALVLVLLLQSIQALGLTELKYNSNHLLFLVIFALIVVSPVLIWLQVNWSLAYVIAVVESKRGLETLRISSAYLVKEKRWVAFGTHLLYGLFVMVIVIETNIVIFACMGAVKCGWLIWIIVMILQIMLPWVLVSFVMTDLLMMNVLLYMYCKDEKLTLEIGGKLADELISLPLDDEKNHECNFLKSRDIFGSELSFLGLLPSHATIE